MEQPTVSVILTARDYGRFLHRSVESVLAQTFEDWELVAVDDGSADETPDLLASYAPDPRVRVVTLSGVGLAAASNAGVRASRGRLVLRLDADDYLDPNALTVMAGELARRPEIGLVYPDYHCVDEEGRSLGHVRVPRVQDGARLLDSPPLAAGCLYRRSCFDAIGGYDETLRFQEDYDFWLRFTERFRAFGVGLPLLNYRQHGGSMSRNLAPRAAARRHVKRTFARRQAAASSGSAICVIPDAWPGAAGRDPALLCRDLGGQAALARVVGQAKACDAIGGTIVATEDGDVERVARTAGAEVVGFPPVEPVPGDPAPLAWLRGLAKIWPARLASQCGVLLLASPFCPLRHPDRLHELLDTLAIHGVDLVVSVDAEPLQAWTAGVGGLGQVSGGGRLLRDAGELLAVRMSWLVKGQALSEAVIGYIELLHPEWWCVKDEASWRVCESLLPEAVALVVPPDAYLRIQP
jgi:hypothetical protein